MLTSGEYHELFEYRDGELYCKTGTSRWKVGRRAGTTCAYGYRVVNIGGKKDKVHRIIWCMVYGSPPDGTIDHINGNRSDNRIENLRLCTQSQNCMNSSQKGGVSIYKGVHLHKKGVFRPTVWDNGKRHSFGLFHCEKEAALAYNYKVDTMFGEFAKFNQVFEDVPQELLDAET